MPFGLQSHGLIFSAKNLISGLAVHPAIFWINLKVPDWYILKKHLVYPQSIIISPLPRESAS